MTRVAELKNYVYFSFIILAGIPGVISCTGPQSGSVAAVADYSGFSRYSEANILNTSIDEDTPLTELKNIAIKLLTAADIYHISDAQLQNFLLDQKTPSLLSDFVFSKADINEGVYFNSSENIALKILPDQLPEDVTVENDEIVLQSGDSVELPSNEMLNLSSGAIIEFDLQNPDKSNLSTVLFRKGSTENRLPYFDSNIGDGITLSWDSARTDEAYNFQLLKSKFNFILHVVDNNSVEHLINVKATGTRSTVNSGNKIHIKITMINNEIRLFIQQLDNSSGEPLFNTDGSPQMKNVTNALGLTNVSATNLMESGQSYQDYIDSIGGLAELDNTDPDDIYVKLNNAVIKATDAPVTLGSFTLEKLNLSDLKSPEDTQPVVTFSSNNIRLSGITVMSN